MADTRHDDEHVELFPELVEYRKEKAAAAQLYQQMHWLLFELVRKHGPEAYEDIRSDLDAALEAYERCEDQSANPYTNPFEVSEISAQSDEVWQCSVCGVRLGKNENYGCSHSGCTLGKSSDSGSRSVGEGWSRSVSHTVYYSDGSMRSQMWAEGAKWTEGEGQVQTE